MGKSHKGLGSVNIRAKDPVNCWSGSFDLGMGRDLSLYSSGIKVFPSPLARVKANVSPLEVSYLSIGPFTSVSTSEIRKHIWGGCSWKAEKPPGKLWLPSHKIEQNRYSWVDHGIIPLAGKGTIPKVSRGRRASPPPPPHFMLKVWDIRDKTVGKCDS